MDVVFKKVRVSDIDTLVEFMREYYEYDHLAFDQCAARSALEGILGNDSFGCLWLIHYGSEVAGYVACTFGYSLEFHGRNAFVDELYIRESYRGRGLGTETLVFIEDTCRSLGIRALHLEVERGNTRAQSLCRKLGFKDHDRYLMTKRL